MGFHPLVLCRKFAIQHREEGNLCIYGMRCQASLLQPGADYLRVHLNARLLVGDDKHLIWDEIKPVLGALALEVAEVHDSTCVHVAEVVPASARQHLQCCDGEVGGGATLPEPVGGAADGDRRADIEEGESQEGLCYLQVHDDCQRELRRTTKGANLFLLPLFSLSHDQQEHPV